MSSRERGKRVDEERGEERSLSGDPIILSIGSIDLKDNQRYNVCRNEQTNLRRCHRVRMSAEYESRKETDSSKRKLRLPSSGSGNKTKERKSCQIVRKEKKRSKGVRVIRRDENVIILNRQTRGREERRERSEF
jgi:hypothetical protein